MQGSWEMAFPVNRAQDLVTCDLCNNPTQQFCNNCQVNLCVSCISKHVNILKSIKHEIVPFKNKKTNAVFLECKRHCHQRCVASCQQCNVPVCIKCVISAHELHNLHEMPQICNDKRTQNEKEMRAKIVWYKEQRNDLIEQLDKLKREKDEQWHEYCKEMKRKEECIEWYKAQQQQKCKAYEIQRQDMLEQFNIQQRIKHEEIDELKKRLGENKKEIDSYKENISLFDEQTQILKQEQEDKISELKKRKDEKINNLKHRLKEAKEESDHLRAALLEAADDLNRIKEQLPKVMQHLEYLQKKEQDRGEERAALEQSLYKDLDKLLEFRRQLSILAEGFKHSRSDDSSQEYDKSRSETSLENPSGSQREQMDRDRPSEFECPKCKWTSRSLRRLERHVNKCLDQDKETSL
ncbi:NF-kappa-B essential modulator-like [Saccostrea cucullata]|uniref:NF-kappa-B essential modulator-like n=1 Tax=Saccostrea cuccullata TaxID=36930 RepID=UPI002ED2C6E4